ALPTYRATIFRFKNEHDNVRDGLMTVLISTRSKLSEFKLGEGARHSASGSSVAPSLKALTHTR
ncbi:MAG: hypothetical protein Q8S22_07465, partial [Eubacteriales bacterium]|nr:hypothetical protein [Eubacteriales bacterium]